jgi:hypothetical protein
MYDSYPSRLLPVLRAMDTDHIIDISDGPPIENIVTHTAYSTYDRNDPNVRRPATGNTHYEYGDNLQEICDHIKKNHKEIDFVYLYDLMEEEWVTDWFGYLTMKDGFIGGL